jgi:serine/threonine protein phosphatase 1
MSLTYAIPDLHGRYDLLCEGLERIWAHAAGRSGTVILLGDYVDKGPQSRQVIDRLRSGLAQCWKSTGWTSVALKGNHDAMMVDGLRDPVNKRAAWFEKGGEAALASYGGEAAGVPPAHIAWLDQLPLMHLDPHRLYVHAGVEAGVALAQQTEQTLLWKRYPPGDPSGFEGRHVVHGHDNFPDGPLLYPGRSNLDTLAWRTGRLMIGIFDDAKAGGPADFIEVHGPPAGTADPD